LRGSKSLSSGEGFRERSVNNKIYVTINAILNYSKMNTSDLIFQKMNNLDKK